MKFKRLLLCAFTVIAFTMSVEAASGSIKASTSARTVAVGSTFTVTVKVSSGEALGSWSYGLSYDNKYLSLQSGDTMVVEYGNGSMKSKTYTYKFKAIKAGSASVNINSPSMVLWSNADALFTPSSSGVTVSVKTQEEIQASYSKDNNLKSLVVEGYELSPQFNKDTTEYTVSVPDTIEQIKVSAAVNDSTARVSGTGEIKLSEGANKVEVVVTAQNGSLKTYVIKIDVRDLNPIETEIDGVKYTVVKKVELLSEPVGHTLTTVNIKDIDVPAFTSELTKLTVVGLKDENGNIALFTYDEGTGEYKKYNEVKNASMTLLPRKIENDLDGFEKTKLKINDVEYEVFKNLVDEDFYVIYAMNVATGDEGYYIYNYEEGTFTSFSPKLLEGLNNENKEYKMFTLAFAGTSVVLLLLLIIVSVKKSKFKKIIRRLSNQMEEMKGRENKTYSKKDEENVSADEDSHEEEKFEDDNFLEDDEKAKNKRGKRKK